MLLTFPGSRTGEEQNHAMRPTSQQPLLEIRNLSVAFDGIKIIHGLDLTVAHGEALGMVGESGSGKSVTWLAALGLLPAKAKISGSVLLDKEQLIGAKPPAMDQIRGRRIALISQDPASALNPVIRIGRQIIEVLGLHRGLHGASARAEAKRLLDLVGLPDSASRLNSYPHELSGGQNQRVMIAMALAGAPELLIADEPTTALDVTIQAQILDLLATIRRETGMAMVLISHDLGVISETCGRVVVMYSGKVVEDAPSSLLFQAPFHPYTRGLLAAIPPFTGTRKRLETIEGQVPNPANLPNGCAFSPRCPLRQSLCDQTPPALAPVAQKRFVACIEVGSETAPIHALRRAQA